jgi:oligopeptide/dipeptide ABC transporter ATP-binding protein
MDERPVLDIRGLCVDFATDAGSVRAVDDVCLEVRSGQTLALVGESGSGKTATSLTIMGLLPGSARVSGQIWFEDQDLLSLPPGRLRRVRGRRIGMIFQEPMSSLNPIETVGRQIVEAIELHTPRRGHASWGRVVEMLDAVGIAAPDERANAYPHEMSGGMRQRVMIAMALACEPSVLIADEPTTALDVTVQAQILDLLGDLQRRTGLAILLITHDLAVVAESAHDAAVMYAGRIVERAPVERLFACPAHPYTRALLECLPRLGEPRGRLASIEGTVPPLTERPAGCLFEPRCSVGRGDRQCVAESPALVEIASVHRAACWKVNA